jgi:hypothetical protein
MHTDVGLYCTTNLSGSYLGLRSESQEMNSQLRAGDLSNNLKCYGVGVVDAVIPLILTV